MGLIVYIPHKHNSIQGLLVCSTVTATPHRSGANCKARPKISIFNILSTIGPILVYRLHKHYVAVLHTR